MCFVRQEFKKGSYVTLLWERGCVRCPPPSPAWVSFLWSHITSHICFMVYEISFSRPDMNAWKGLFLSRCPPVTGLLCDNLSQCAAIASSCGRLVKLCLMLQFLIIESTGKKVLLFRGYMAMSATLFLLTITLSLKVSRLLISRCSYLCRGWWRLTATDIPHECLSFPLRLRSAGCRTAACSLFSSSSFVSPVDHVRLPLETQAIYQGFHF